VVNKDETLEAIIAGAKANGSWDKKYPDDDKKAQPPRDLVIYKDVTPLYTTPPQRPWVGLTDEEMQALWNRYAYMEMMRAIEAKLKEKNFD